MPKHMKIFYYYKGFSAIIGFDFKVSNLIQTADFLKARGVDFVHIPDNFYDYIAKEWD
jgi:4-hydroxyphenylpyruvate dioxygenase-like putative hemolysin